MSGVLSSGKAGHLKSFVLIPHLPSSQLWLATGNTVQQVQLIKPWTSRRDCQMLLWTKPCVMDQRVGKGVKRTIAFPGALKGSRDFWRSKFPKRVWINLLHASKQSQWECLTLTPLALCHFPCSQQHQQTVTMKHRGCREKHKLQHGFFKRWESHAKRKWFVSRKLLFKLHISYSDCIWHFQNHVIFGPYSIPFCSNPNHFKTNAQVLVLKLGYTHWNWVGNLKKFWSLGPTREVTD